MILTRTINIKITAYNLPIYEEWGYDDISIGECLEIPVELLLKGSHIKILCKCDDCGAEKEVIYKNYLKYDHNWEVYFCRKCSEFKRKKTLNENMGVDYPIQKDDIKKTILSKRKRKK